MWASRTRELLIGMGRYGKQSRRVRIWVSLVVLILVLLVLQTVWPERSPMPKLVGPFGPGTIIAVFLAALLCEYVDSSLGMGYGTTLTPLLLLAGFEPLQIVPAVLLSEFVTGVSAGLLHHRDGNVDFVNDRQARWTAILLSMLSVVGALVAVTVAIAIPKFWLTLIIASIICSVGAMIVLTSRRQLAYRKGHIVALGAVAAFNKGLSGGGYGPLVTGGQVVSGMPPKHAVAITSLTEALTCCVGLIAYIMLSGSLDWGLAIPLTLGALLSVPMATLTVRKLPEKVIRGSVGLVTCALGLLTFVKLFT